MPFVIMTHYRQRNMFGQFILGLGTEHFEPFLKAQGVVCLENRKLLSLLSTNLAIPNGQLQCVACLFMLLHPSV